MLVLVECSAEGLLVSYDYYDDSAIDAAMVELERRFINGEGSPHAYVLERRRDAGRVEEGSDGYLALFSPTCRIVNHCRMGWPMSSVDDVVERSNANRQITTKTQSLPRWIEGAHSTVISLYEDEYLTPEGSEYSSMFVRVTQFASGLVEFVEVYDPEDFDVAYARFEELAVAVLL